MCGPVEFCPGSFSAANYHPRGSPLFARMRGRRPRVCCLDDVEQEASADDELSLDELRLSDRKGFNLAFELDWGQLFASERRRINKGPRNRSKGAPVLPSCPNPAAAEPQFPALPSRHATVSDASSTAAAASASASAPPLQLLILWVTLFGTSLFLLLMVLHAYHLTSPLGSPRIFAVGGPGWSGGGYSAVGSAVVPVFATPLQPPPSIDAAARAQRERELQRAEAEALDALVS